MVCSTFWCDGRSDPLSAERQSDIPTCGVQTAVGIVDDRRLHRSRGAPSTSLDRQSGGGAATWSPRLGVEQLSRRRGRINVCRGRPLPTPGLDCAVTAARYPEGVVRQRQPAEVDRGVVVADGEIVGIDRRARSAEPCACSLAVKADDGYLHQDGGGENVHEDVGIVCSKSVGLLPMALNDATPVVEFSVTGSYALFHVANGWPMCARPS